MPDNRRYAVIDASGTIVNAIVGPANILDHTVVLMPDGAWIGWTRNANGTFSPPTTAEGMMSDADRIAALEERLRLLDNPDT